MTAITKLQFSNYVQIFVAAGEIHSYDIWHISQPRTPEDSDDSQVKEAECWADSYDGVQFYSCSAGETLAQSQVILRKC